VKIRNRIFTPSLPILLVFLLLFQTLPPPKAYALSIEEEQALGQEFLAKVRERYVFLEDSTTQKILDELGEYLTSPLETRPFPFRFYLVKDRSINAFAAPGGHIFIFSGLIEVMETMDELAAVLCHEIAHVSARHLSQRMSQSKKISMVTLAGILAGVLLGGGAMGEALMTGSLAAAVQTQLHYSREDERQADQMGFKYMEATGFDPSGMLETLKKIERENWMGTHKVPPYLLTHPAGPERMSSLEIQLNQSRPQPTGTRADRFRGLFPFLKTSVRAESLDSREAERIFKGNLEKDPDDPLSHMGLGIVYVDRSDYESAVRHLEKALQGGIGEISILTRLGESYHRKGEDEKAIGILERAMELREDPAILFLLSLSYENLGQYGKSTALLEKLASYPPVKDEVYYHLGLSYGRQERLALAHYNFGIYFSRGKQSDLAGFHFKKAENLSKDDPILMKKIQDAAQPLGRR
jgi:beta-barrel assembly-enhancing protease